MPQNYIRRTDRGGWSEEQMKLAIQQVLEGKTAIITASPYKNELEERQNSKKPKPKVTNKTKINKTNKRSKKTKKADEGAQTSDDEDTECLYCHGLYSESTEGWITCQTCGKWAHCGCAGVEDNDDEAVHICPVCEDDDV